MVLGFCFYSEEGNAGEYPALIIELKWNKSARTAIQQIKEKKYPESVASYSGELLLVGISYDKKAKQRHQCVIETYNEKITN